MAVIRQMNVLGQMRVDVPHLRSLESAVAADFDVMAGKMWAGGRPLVVRGFALITTGVTAASDLEVDVADGLILHPTATESGTIFWVPATVANEQLATTNTKVTGSFTASATNYVGLDLSRAADSSTTGSLQFLGSDTLRETTKTIPLARTLNYRFVVSTSDFSGQPTILPLAIVTTDASNNVTTVTDARSLAFRLDAGGDFPATRNPYSWPQDRDEATSSDEFEGGDKSIESLKDWVDAAMTRMWELGGGEYWYSPTADRNVTMIGTGSAFSTGEHFEWTGTHLHWQGIRFLFDNSTVTYNTVTDQATDSSGLTNLADGECVYVDLNRAAVSALTAVKTSLATVGVGAIPGSRHIMAWRVGSAVFIRGKSQALGSVFAAATSSSLGLVQLNGTPASSSNPVVLTVKANGLVEHTATAGNSNALNLTSHGTGIAVFASGGESVSVAAGGVGGYLRGGFNNSTGPGGIGSYIEGGGSSGGAGGVGLNVSGGVGSGAVRANAITATGKVQVDSGDVEVDSGQNFKYASAVSRNVTVLAMDMVESSGTGAIYTSADTTGSTLNTSLPYWLSSSDSGSLDCQVNVPAGAVVTDVQLLVQDSSSAAGLRLKAFFLTKGASLGSAAVIAAHDVLSELDSSGSGSQEWLAATVTQQTAPVDGVLVVKIGLDQDHVCRIYAVRVSYTQTTVAPAI